jgi:hypothetical protein
VEDGLDDEVDVGVVQAGDGVVEVDGYAVREAGGEAEDAACCASLILVMTASLTVRLVGM